MLELMTVGVEGGLTMANITTALTDCFSLMAGVLEQLVSQPVLLCLFAVSFIGVGVSVFKKIKRPLLKGKQRNAARPMWADGYFFRSIFFGRTFTVGGDGSSLIIFSHFLKS